VSDDKPESDLQYALDQFYERSDGRPNHPDVLSRGTVDVPVYVVEDAIDRLKRYETITQTLTSLGNFLWMENLRKYGERKINKKETPLGVFQNETYQRMCSFVDRPKNSGWQLDDAFVELALSMARIATGDPSGLSQYLDKEYELFDQLEGGE
jgi:hypothetical protein